MSDDSISEVTSSESEGDEQLEDATQTEGSKEDEEVRYIGPITEKERLEKVRKYLHKKHNKANMRKYTYVCRQQVAEKRLRIKGRFVTK